MSLLHNRRGAVLGISVHLDTVAWALRPSGGAISRIPPYLWHEGRWRTSAIHQPLHHSLGGLSALERTCVSEVGDYRANIYTDQNDLAWRQLQGSAHRRPGGKSRPLRQISTSWQLHPWLSARLRWFQSVSKGVITAFALSNQNHWKQNIVNLTTLSSLVAPEVVITTTYGVIIAVKVVKLAMFCFQWYWPVMSMLFLGCCLFQWPQRGCVCAITPLDAI